MTFTTGTPPLQPVSSPESASAENPLVVAVAAAALEGGQKCEDAQLAVDPDPPLGAGASWQSCRRLLPPLPGGQRAGGDRW